MGCARPGQCPAALYAGNAWDINADGVTDYSGDAVISHTYNSQYTGSVVLLLFLPNRGERLFFTVFRRCFRLSGIEQNGFEPTYAELE